MAEHINKCIMSKLMRDIDDKERVFRKVQVDSKPATLFDKYPRDKVYFDVQNEMRQDMTRFAKWHQGDDALADLREHTRKELALMEQAPRLHPYEWNDVLWLAARDHCLNQADHVSFSHVGTNGSMPWHRINEYSEVLQETSDV